VYTFVETTLFTRLIDEYLTDDEFSALQAFMVANPDAGDIIKGSGGVRKLRWSGSGRGKRGGLRVIYFLRLQQGQIWLLTAYAKNVKDSISGAVLKRIKEQLDASYP
jgi:hypothetical protein